MYSYDKYCFYSVFGNKTNNKVKIDIQFLFIFRIFKNQ